MDIPFLVLGVNIVPQVMSIEARIFSISWRVSANVDLNLLQEGTYLSLEVLHYFHVKS